MIILVLYRIITGPSHPNISKKRALANFFKYLLLNPKNALRKSQVSSEKSEQINSRTWSTFNSYLDLAVSFLSPKYLLNSHVLLNTSGGYADTSLLPGGKNEVDISNLKYLPGPATEVLQKVSAKLAKGSPQSTRGYVFIGFRLINLEQTQPKLKERNSKNTMTTVSTLRLELALVQTQSWRRIYTKIMSAFTTFQK